MVQNIFWANIAECIKFSAFFSNSASQRAHVVELTPNDQKRSVKKGKTRGGIVLFHFESMKEWLFAIVDINSLSYFVEVAYLW